jgi:hypothetical protein
MKKLCKILQILILLFCMVFNYFLMPINFLIMFLVNIISEYHDKKRNDLVFTCLACVENDFVNMRRSNFCYWFDKYYSH